MLKASRSVASEAATQIQARILNGEWPGGTMLPGQRLLSQSLSISRASLREAISMLEGLGLVRPQPGKGVLVTYGTERRCDQLPAGPGDTQPAALLQFRLALEPLAAMLAASAITPAQASALWALQSDLDEAVLNTDLVRASEADLAFHLKVAEISGNPMIAEAIRNASAGLAHSLRLPFAETARIRETAEEHRRITAAITASEPAAARRAMHAHLAGAAARAGLSPDLLNPVT
ncbi:FCD domain-containing protein [Granulosicoccaceae sp. 1_MG-2023]|nr:FCD domain-containing protein [Granulosicoccaceae sp. 1_MG-2023]